MKTGVDRLLAIAGPRLAPGPALLTVPPSCRAKGLVAELLDLLNARNGFYCFEGALHVFPTLSHGGHTGLEAWNGTELWRYEYGGLVEGMLFFAEDVFGNQFTLSDDAVCTFDAETAEVEQIAGSVADWIGQVLDDFELLTGFPLAHQWQTQCGALQVEHRLVPKVPFVLGGEYAVENLYACKAAAGMRARGNLARQLLDLPDGAAVQYSIEE